MTNVLAVIGSTRPDSVTKKLVEIAAESAKAQGGEVRTLDLGATLLPVLIAGDAEQQAMAAVKLVKESATWADAFIIGTPEYHGGPSGAIKNWIDHLYPEIAGKVAGLVGAAGGGRADQALGQLEIHSRMCHMWTLPFITATSGRDFEGNTLTNDSCRDRLERLGVDLVRYGALFRDQFAADIAKGKGSDSGFAGWHVPKEA